MDFGTFEQDIKARDAAAAAAPGSSSNSAPIALGPLGGPISGSADLYRSKVRGHSLSVPVTLNHLDGPASGLAAVAICAAGKQVKAQSCRLSWKDAAFHGLAERASLAEAALQAVIRSNEMRLAEDGFFGDMWTIIKRIAPVVNQVAPMIAGVLDSPQIRLGIASSMPESSNSRSSKLSDRPRRPSSIPRVVFHSHSLDVGIESFLNRIQAATVNTGRAHEADENFFDVNIIAKRALNLAGPVLSDVASDALPRLLKLTEESGSGEDAPIRYTSEYHEITERAIFAEAALQTAIESEYESLEDEGFFDHLVAVLEDIYPTIAKLSPIIINQVIPIVHNLAEDDESDDSLEHNTDYKLQKGPFNTTLDGSPRAGSTQTESFPNQRKETLFVSSHV